MGARLFHLGTNDLNNERLAIGSTARAEDVLRRALDGPTNGRVVDEADVLAPLGDVGGDGQAVVLADNIIGRHVLRLEVFEGTLDAAAGDGGRAIGFKGVFAVITVITVGLKCEGMKCVSKAFPSLDDN